MIKVVCFLIGVFTGLAIGNNHCIAPNEASLKNVRVIVKPRMTKTEFNAWAESVRR